jgi:hypothetical protein
MIALLKISPVYKGEPDASNLWNHAIIVPFQ